MSADLLWLQLALLLGLADNHGLGLVLAEGLLIISLHLVHLLKKIHNFLPPSIDSLMERILLLVLAGRKFLECTS